MTQDSTNLDLLRSFAVLFVLLDHTLKFWGLARIGPADIDWLGRLGVAFFFVHTSLVLMLSLERSKLRGWRLSANFYARRAFRIYPLSCFFVVLVSVARIPQASIHAHEFRIAAMSPLVFLSNFTLTQNVFGTNYVLGQLWSLPVEVDMYLILPFLFLLARRWPRRFVWFSWPLSIIVALVVPQVRGLWHLQVLRYSPCFIPGVMAYALSKRSVPRLNSWLWPPFLLILMAVFLLRASWNLTWVICLMLGLAVVWFKDQTYRPVNEVTHAIAKYSYGIYLGHTVCIWVAFSVLSGWAWPIQWVTFAILICGVPYLAFITIERPGIEVGKRLAQGLTQPSPALASAREVA